MFAEEAGVADPASPRVPWSAGVNVPNDSVVCIDVELPA